MVVLAASFIADSTAGQVLGCRQYNVFCDTVFSCAQYSVLAIAMHVPYRVCYARMCS